MENIVYLVPLIVLIVLLAIVSAIHVIRHPHYKCGNKAIWLIVVLFVQIIGPVLYFTIGKGDDQ